MKKVILFLGTTLLLVGLLHCGAPETIMPEEITPKETTRDSGIKHAEKTQDSKPQETKSQESRPESECLSGTTKPCYGGTVGTRGTGACKAGFVSCKGGKWGQKCYNVVLPAEEKCGDGVDNDCDGEIDEGCKCTSGATQGCYPFAKGCSKVGKGFKCNAPCKAGAQTCSNNQWGACKGTVSGTKEKCNHKDDDCDGKVDNVEGMGEPCLSSGKGRCKAGIQKCADKGLVCKSTNQPAKESCNGIDDDCDGQIDNHLTPPKCPKQKGVCTNAVQKCAHEKGWRPCSDTSYGNDFESKETKCDNKDNDCDGQIDEHISKTCYGGKAGTSGSGVCKSGKSRCSNGKWGTCVGQILPKKEACNGKDDDCDGAVDENIFKPCYGGKTGTSGVGICKSGKSMCSNGKWLACTGQVLRTKEICNGKVDDCNGKDDDTLTPHLCANQKGVCKGSSSLKCEGVKGWAKCIPETYTRHSKAYTKVETKCDNKDNDCDGVIDELCVMTYAGILGKSGATNGARGVAKLGAPVGIAFDSKGNLYVADSGNYAIRKVDPQGKISTFAGVIGKKGKSDTRGTVPALFREPSVVVYKNGFLYIIDGESTEMVLRSAQISTGKVTTLQIKGLPQSLADMIDCGKYVLCLSSEKPKKIYKLNLKTQSLTSITTSASSVALAISSISPSKLYFTSVSDVVGGYSSIHEGNKTVYTYPQNKKGSPYDRLNVPFGIVFQKGTKNITGNDILYVANTGASTIQRFDLVTKKMQTFAGKEFSTRLLLDGHITKARFWAPTRVLLDPTGRYLFVTDLVGYSIRRITLE